MHFNAFILLECKNWLKSVKQFKSLESRILVTQLCVIFFHVYIFYLKTAQLILMKLCCVKYNIHTYQIVLHLLKSVKQFKTILESTLWTYCKDFDVFFQVCIFYLKMAQLILIKFCGVKYNIHTYRVVLNFPKSVKQFKSFKVELCAHIVKILMYFFMFLFFIWKRLNQSRSNFEVLKTTFILIEWRSILRNRLSSSRDLESRTLCIHCKDSDAFFHVYIFYLRTATCYRQHSYLSNGVKFFKIG